MKKSLTFSVVSFMLFCVTSNTNAELWLIGSAEYNDGAGPVEYNLIYDTEQQLVFLDYVRSYDLWLNQKNWAESLTPVVTLHSEYITNDDLSSGWRLPLVDNPEDTSSSRFGWNQDPDTGDYLGHDDSELARLYYAALGNLPRSEYENNNYGDFQNIPNDSFSYWTGSIVGDSSSSFRWDFKLANGEQFGGDSTTQTLLAMAVKDAVVTTTSVTAANKYLIEDWETTPALDASWQNVGGTDSKVYIENGELHHVVRPYSYSSAEVLNVRNRFSSATYNQLTAFQTLVRIEAVGDIGQTPEIEYAAVEFGGLFYNTMSNPIGGNGAVWFQVRYGDRGAGLEAWWSLLEFADDDYDTHIEHDSGTFTPPAGGWVLGQNYLLDVSYDGNSTLSASFNGNVTGPVVGPTRLSPPAYAGKWIRSRISLLQPFTGDPGINRFHAVFDDVQVGLNSAALAPYDSFSLPLSVEKWRDNELLRESTVVDGMLKMRYLTASGDTISSSGAKLRNGLPAKYDQTDFIQFDMKIEGGIIPEGTRGEMRMNGAWGNGKYDTSNYPGNSDGQISFDANLRRKSSAPYEYQIECFLSMCDNSNCSSLVDFNFDASAPAEPDVFYTAKLWKRDTQFFCEVSKESDGSILISESIDIQNQGISNIAPVGEHKRFWAAVRENPGEIIGYLDNVYVEIVPGDVDLNGEIELLDVIQGLKILTGSVSDGSSPGADVNGDNRFGLQEVLYDLNMLVTE